MTTQTQQPISEQEIINLLHTIGMIRNQIKADRLDSDFLSHQLDKMVSLLKRAEAETYRRRQESRFEALYNVTRLLGSSLDLQIALDQVMDAIIQLTGAERGFLMLQDVDGELTVKAARNFDQQTLSDDKSKYSRTIVNQVMNSGQPVVTTNAAEDPRFAGQASIVGQALRSIMATPLRARGNILGVVYVDNRVITGLFDETDLAALDTFAGQAAVAIDNAQLFSATDKQLSQRVETLTQLRRVDLHLNETLDADRAMQITLEWACRLSGAINGYLGLLENEPPYVRCAHSVGVVDDPCKTLEQHYPHIKIVAQNGVTLSTTDQQTGKTLFIVPVRREQQVIGIVVLTNNTPFKLETQDLIERIVARAAVAIENARLYAAVKAADRAKSEFVGIVAHDLKVPMTSIMGYADLTILEGKLTKRQKEFQNKIIDTVKRMEQLVTDLADISRIESGLFYINVTNVNVQTVIQEVKDNTFTQIKTRKHKFVEDIAPELPELKTDYYRLIQILTNLVSNAYKYTPTGGTITLYAHPRNQGIEFKVSDTGIGMSAETLKMLGTKFWRANDAFTRSQPGAGLGFAITRSLIEQVGSEIRVESEPNKGTTITFHIPIVRNDAIITTENN